jgi:ligand-binding SRPBCC domain-containing protein
MKLRLTIQTRIPLSAEEALSRFDKSLFLALNPPFPPVQVIRFDGCKKGDEVELELNFLVFRQRWVSIITEDYNNTNEIGFVDEGTKLPFFLSYWQHRHRILKRGSTSMVLDDITFSGGGVVLSLLLYPLLYLQFLYRIPIYKRLLK